VVVADPVVAVEVGVAVVVPAAVVSDDDD